MQSGVNLVQLYAQCVYILMILHNIHVDSDNTDAIWYVYLPLLFPNNMKVIHLMHFTIVYNVFVDTRATFQYLIRYLIVRARRLGLARMFVKILVSLWNLACALAGVAEQITVRIVQIMIQATDLAQILYGGHYSRKKRGPRKISIWPPFSKMAAMEYPELGFLS